MRGLFLDVMSLGEVVLRSGLIPIVLVIVVVAVAVAIVVRRRRKK